VPSVFSTKTVETVVERCPGETGSPSPGDWEALLPGALLIGTVSKALSVHPAAKKNKKIKRKTGIFNVLFILFPFQRSF
jgi:hypothetical protein